MRIPVVAEQIRPEVRDGVKVVGAVEDLQHAEVDPGRGDLAGPKHNPDLVIGDPARRDPPTAVHLQVRMDTCRPDPDEQVLTAAQYLVDRVVGQVNGGVLGHPDIASGQGPADQCVAQGCGGTKDGVALRHCWRLCRWAPVEAALGRDARQCAGSGAEDVGDPVANIGTGAARDQCL